MTNATQQRYVVRLKLHDREVAQWIVDQRPLTIGRTPDNDIVIDNLAVSRRHARIEEGPQGLVIRDEGSVNGLEVDGRTCAEAPIGDGTQVRIGKHVLSFEAVTESRPAPASADPESYDATIQATETPRLANPACLVEQGSDGEVRYPIDTALFLMGKGDAADVRLDGLLIAKYHVEIRVDEGEHRIAHLEGRRKLRVNGRETSQGVLRDGDRIEVAGRTFVFRASD